MQSEADLWSAWRKAESFNHRGARGDAREDAFRQLLRDRLPGDFDIVKAEVVDWQNRRTPQLDLVIYDKSRNAPLTWSSKVAVLPAEAVLGVVEIKSRLTQAEIDKAYQDACSIYSLRPNKDVFEMARARGAPAAKPRVLNSVVAFKTNLGSKDWASKEWSRLENAAKKAETKVNALDYLVVLETGMINVAGKTAWTETESAQSAVLHDWFLSLINFLVRESIRRPSVDWQIYSRRNQAGWSRITS